MERLEIVAGDLVHRCTALYLVGEQVAEGLLPQRSADGEAVEAGHRSGDPEPLEDLRLVRFRSPTLR